MSMFWTGLRTVATLILIEQIWNELWRFDRRNHAIHTVNDLAAALQAKWTKLPATFIQRYVNSLHRRITACIAQISGHTRYWHISFRFLQTLIAFQMNLNQSCYVTVSYKIKCDFGNWHICDITRFFSMKELSQPLQIFKACQQRMILYYR